MFQYWWLCLSVAALMWTSDVRSAYAPLSGSDGSSDAQHLDDVFTEICDKERCDILTQYCEPRTKKCNECSSLCRESRIRESEQARFECHNYCRVYMALKDRGLLSPTSSGVPSVPTGTTVPWNTMLALMIVVVAILGLVLLLVAITLVEVMRGAHSLKKILHSGISNNETPRENRNGRPPGVERNIRDEAALNEMNPRGDRNGRLPEAERNIQAEAAPNVTDSAESALLPRNIPDVGHSELAESMPGVVAPHGGEQSLVSNAPTEARPEENFCCFCHGYHGVSGTLMSGYRTDESSVCSMENWSVRHRRNSNPHLPQERGYPPGHVPPRSIGLESTAAYEQRRHNGNPVARRNGRHQGPASYPMRGDRVSYVDGSLEIFPPVDRPVLAAHSNPDHLQTSMKTPIGNSAANINIMQESQPPEGRRNRSRGEDSKANELREEEDSL